MHSSSFLVSFFTFLASCDGIYTPSRLERSFNISDLDLSLFSLQIFTTLILTSSPSPTIKKSKKSLYGKRFALTTGPPANISGKTSPRSADLSGIPYFSSIEKIVKKSVSNVKENPISPNS